MGITNNGTVNSIPSDKIPAEYVRPTVTQFECENNYPRQNINIAVSSIADTATITGMEELVTAIGVVCKSTIETDYPNLDAHMYTEIKDFETVGENHVCSVLMYFNID